MSLVMYLLSLIPAELNTLEVLLSNSKREVFLAHEVLLAADDGVVDATRRDSDPKSNEDEYVPR